MPNKSLNPHLIPTEGSLAKLEAGDVKGSCRAVTHLCILARVWSLAWSCREPSGLAPAQPEGLTPRWSARSSRRLDLVGLLHRGTQARTDHKARQGQRSHRSWCSPAVPKQGWWQQQASSTAIVRPYQGGKSDLRSTLKSRRQNKKQETEVDTSIPVVNLWGSSGEGQGPSSELKWSSWAHGQSVWVEAQVRLVRASEVYWCIHGLNFPVWCFGMDTDFSNQTSHPVTSIMLLVSVPHRYVFFQLLTWLDHQSTHTC